MSKLSAHAGALGRRLSHHLGEIVGGDNSEEQRLQGVDEEGISKELEKEEEAIPRGSQSRRQSLVPTAAPDTIYYKVISVLSAPVQLFHRRSKRFRIIIFVCLTSLLLHAISSIGNPNTLMSRSRLAGYNSGFSASEDRLAEARRLGMGEQIDSRLQSQAQQDVEVELGEAARFAADNLEGRLLSQGKLDVDAEGKTVAAVKLPAPDVINNDLVTVVDSKRLLSPAAELTALLAYMASSPMNILPPKKDYDPMTPLPAEVVLDFEMDGVRGAEQFQELENGVKKGLVVFGTLGQ